MPDVDTFPGRFGEDSPAPSGVGGLPQPEVSSRQSLLIQNLLTRIEGLEARISPAEIQFQADVELQEFKLKIKSLFNGADTEILNMQEELPPGTGPLSISWATIEAAINEVRLLSA